MRWRREARSQCGGGLHLSEGQSIRFFFSPSKAPKRARGEREEEEKNEGRERLLHPNPPRTGSDLGVKAERGGGEAGREKEEKQLYPSFPERIDLIFLCFSLCLLSFFIF